MPADDRWLAELVGPLRADSGVAGTFARQSPRRDAGALTRLYLERAAAASPQSRTLSPLSETELLALQPINRLRRTSFDNVSSCIRRSVWSRMPFGSTPIAEDVGWAKDVLLAGFRLEFVATSVVVHSHDRPARYEFARTYTLHRRLFELLGLRTIPTMPLLARAIASSLALHLRCERRWRSAALAVAWPLGQYLGALSAVRGWKHDRLGTV